MSARSSHATRLGLGLLAAALGLSLFAIALGAVWTAVLSAGRLPVTTARDLRTLWMPISLLVVDAATAVVGVFGFLMVWRGRSELGAEYGSRVGLAMLAALVAGVAYALFALTGILLAYVAAFAFLVPWHSLLALVGGVALGFALYWILANLPLAGSRPMALIALVLGIAGLTLLDASVLGLPRFRPSEFLGAGFGLAIASLVVWLVLCLWGEETVRGGRALPPPAAATNG